MDSNWVREATDEQLARWIAEYEQHIERLQAATEQTIATYQGLIDLYCAEQQRRKEAANADR